MSSTDHDSKNIDKEKKCDQHFLRKVYDTVLQLQLITLHLSLFYSEGGHFRLVGSPTGLFVSSCFFLLACLLLNTIPRHLPRSSGAFAGCVGS